MEHINIESWAHFLAQVNARDGWAFRGQRVAAWPLASSLYRRLAAYCPDPATWPDREARALRIFRRKAHIYLADRRVLEDDLRCLAMMQHHGAPTRLLDFTKSPFVAAFFALEQATEDAAVFALNTPALWNATPAGAPELARERIDPRLPRNFATYFSPNNRAIFWCGEPAEMDHRLVAQSGLFVVPGQIHMPLDTILSHYAAPQALLTRLVIGPALRESFMRELYRMNITDATLFPDLDGLARSVAYELEVEWTGAQP